MHQSAGQHTDAGWGRHFDEMVSLFDPVVYDRGILDEPLEAVWDAPWQARRMLVVERVRACATLVRTHARSALIGGGASAAVVSAIALRPLFFGMLAFTVAVAAARGVAFVRRRREDAVVERCLHAFPPGPRRVPVEVLLGPLFDGAPSSR
jgi:hypothetical protein